MRPLVFAALGVVIGVVIGGLPAQSRVRSLELKVAELADRDCGGGGFAGAVSGMLQGAARPVETEADDPDGVEEPPFDDAGERNTPSQPAADEAPADPQAQLAVAKEALELRRTQARAALIEQAGADEAQIQQIDDAAAQMNDELIALTEDFAADVLENGPPSRRDAMVYANEALNVLITAEDRMNAALTDDQRSAIEDETLDPTSFLDPALIERLQALQLEGERRNAADK